MYSDGQHGRDGCGFWIAALLALHHHFAVIHQEPPRLLVVVRSPRIALNAMITHADVEGVLESEAWWVESRRVACLIPTHGTSDFLCLR